MRNSILAAAVAAACLTSTAFAEESTKVGATAFIDFTDINAKSTVKSTGVETDGAQNGYGMDVKRFYLIVDHTFDDIWSANLTTDTQYSTYSASAANVNNTSNADTHLLIKKAYVQAKISDAFVLRAGSYDTPYMGLIDGLYGYRYVEKSINDLNGVINTADWGLHATGTFGGGLVSYAASVVDGAGYRTPARSKRPDFEGRISVVPVKGLTLVVGGYSGKEGKDTQTVENTPTQTTNTFSRYNAAVAYVVTQFRVGVEYYSLKNFTNVVITAAAPQTDKQRGISGWAAWNFLPNASVFARYDDTKLHNHDTTLPTQVDTKKYMQAGVSYSPRKNVDFALVYKDTKTDADYTTATNTAVKTDEIGVFSLVRF